MDQFVHAFVGPLRETFFQKALLGGSVAAIVCSVVGCLVILRRMAFLGDALSHAMIAGVAAGVPVHEGAFLHRGACAGHAGRLSHRCHRYRGLHRFRVPHVPHQGGRGNRNHVYRRFCSWRGACFYLSQLHPYRLNALHHGRRARRCRRGPVGRGDSRGFGALGAGALFSPVPIDQLRSYHGRVHRHARCAHRLRADHVRVPRGGKCGEHGGSHPRGRASYHSRGYCLSAQRPT